MDKLTINQIIHEYAEETAKQAEEQFLASPHPFETVAAIKDRAQAQSKKSIAQLYAQVQLGLGLFLKESQPEGIQTLYQILTFFEELDLNELLSKWSQHCDDQGADRLYKIALKTLNEQNWSHAESAFLLLALLWPQKALFWQGLGIAQQEMGRYEEAILAYTQAVLQDQNLGWPQLFTAECFYQLKDQDNAQLALEAAMHTAQCFECAEEYHLRLRELKDKFNGR